MPFQSSTNQYQISKYIVDGTGDTPYTTIQAAITAATTAAIDATVVIRPGIYTEDLTLFDGIMLQGVDRDTTIITGVHTPPNAGTLLIKSLTLTSPTDIIESAAAGTTEIRLDDCFINCTNGYIYDLLNWTGTVEIVNTIDESTLCGIVNNTGGSNVNLFNAGLGAGANVLIKTGGELAIFNCNIQCPITTAGACIVNAIMGSQFENTVTLGGTTTSTFNNCSFVTGANTAIMHGSTNETSLSNVSIDTSNVVTIGGAGAGNLLIGSVTYLDTFAIAGTLTVVRTTKLDAGAIEGIDLDIIDDTAAGTVEATISNIDNTATASNSALNISVGGTTSTGDPYVSFMIPAGTSYALGPDNSDSDRFKLRTGANPSAGTVLIEIEGNADTAAFNIRSINQVVSANGALVSYAITNSRNTGNSRAGLVVTSNGGSTGDSFVNFVIVGGVQYSIGTDNSDSDNLKLTNGADPSTGDEILDIENDRTDASFNIEDIVQNMPQEAGLISYTITNTTNTATDSRAALNLVNGGTTSLGDMYVNWLIPASTTYSMGIDVDDSDKLTISNGASPSVGTTLWEMYPTGERVIPVQPAFLGYPGVTYNNVTGAGTVYTIPMTSEHFDQSNDYNAGTSTFTSPVTGKYPLTLNVAAHTLGAANTSGHITLITSNNTFSGTRINPGAIRDVANHASFHLNVLADMDAADTCTMTIVVAGGGADTVGVTGTNVLWTNISGALIC